MALIHGGDTVSFEMEYGYEPLDYSANCNPLGVPSGVKRAISQAAEKIDEYPDPLCRKLTAAISGYEGVPPEFVLCGNGSADLIDRLVYARKPLKAVITDPTFAEYERCLMNISCHIIHHHLSENDGFRVTDNIIFLLQPDVDVLFLCSPNNPTGLTIENDLLQKILNICLELNILLVIDECFNGFLDNPDLHTLKPKLQVCANLLILKAFTKIFGMAGVRLGYCLSSDAKLLAGMRIAGQPWAVSSLAQAAGIAALLEKDYVQTARVLIQEEREYLSGALRTLGMQVYDSEANYIFFRTDIPELTGKMREKGILIRDCSQYPGLSSGYYRIAVRTHSENIRLIDELSACKRESLW